MADEDKSIRTFIIFYALLIIALKLMGGILDFEVGILDFPSLNDFSLLGMIGFVGGAVAFLLSLILFTTEFWFINIFLWGYRIIVVMDLILAAKRRLTPTAN